MAPTDDRTLVTVADPVALAKAAADRLLARMAAQDGRIAICLSGGSSPKRLYELLATETYREKIPWDRVHWFMRDGLFSIPLHLRPTSTRSRPTPPILTKPPRATSES